MTGGRRTADVVSLAPMKLLKLGRHTYETYLRRMVEVEQKLALTAAKRAGDWLSKIRPDDQGGAMIETSNLPKKKKKKKKKKKLVGGAIPHAKGLRRPAYLRAAAERVAQLKQITYERMDISPGHHVLDVGCGPEQYDSACGARQ